MTSRDNGNNGDNNLDHVSDEGFKELYPDAAAKPLLSEGIGESNPGVRLLSNDETITEMLKGLNFNDERQAAACAFALGENEIFLYDENNKVNKEVERIRSRIKYRATSQCSVRGLWADQYKQAAIGVATSTATARGFVPLNIAGNTRKMNEELDGNHNKPANNRKLW